MAAMPENVTGTVTLDLTCPDCQATKADVRLRLPLFARADEERIVVEVPSETIEVEIACTECPRTVKYGEVPFRLEREEWQSDQGEAGVPFEHEAPPGPPNPPEHPDDRPIG